MNYIYETVLKEINYNKKLRLSGKDITIPFPFERFGEYIPGIQRGRYNIITANSKVGKTKITDFLYLYNCVDYVLKNPNGNIKPKIFYFTLEMSKEEKIAEAMSHKLFIDYKILISSDKFFSNYKNYILSNEIQEIINSEKFKNWLKIFESIVVFIDNIKNPKEIGNYVYNYALENGLFLNYDNKPINPKNYKGYYKYLRKDKEEMPIIILDHISLLSAEEDYNNDLHKAIGQFSSKYCIYFRNILNYTTVIVQQQAAAQESAENLKLNMLQPSANGLADNKLTGRDADLILGLFSPFRFKIPTYEGYDIKNKFRDYFRELSVVVNRRGPSVVTPLYFNGMSNYFEELESSEKFNLNESLYNKYLKL